MSKSKLIATASVVAALAFSGIANATEYVVSAYDNSIADGPAGGVATLNVTSGEHLSVFTPTTDIWNAGALPRWSNANGLIGNLYATGSDASGEPAGTLIGTNFGDTTQDGYTAPFGSLVGEIGGVYQLLGTSFKGTAWATGTLYLYYWDSNYGDNSGAITSSVEVPEPATWALMLVGFGGVGALLRRRAATAPAT
jgi:hypothetical protein